MLNILQLLLADLIDVGQVTSIDTLPDDVLIQIFNYHGYDDNDLYREEREKVWQTLVHVCRRWRSIVFGSPRHLNLQLVCTPRTPARDMLGIWPALPLNIVSYGDYPTLDNFIAALECTDRVREIFLRIVPSSDSDIFGAMQQPFPELTQMQLWSTDETVSIVPDSFLGGSAPRLEFLYLVGIPFPGLPKLLLSATHLTHFYLGNIPHSGYISPDGMVTALSTLTSLERLGLQFQSPRSCPDPASRRPPPSTRFVVPVLTSFRFKGVSEYLEDLVACIDAPQLNNLDITFFNDIAFDTPQLIQFICRTPRSKELQKAYITFKERAARVNFSSRTSRFGNLKVEILCTGLDWQFSSLEQVCTSCMPPLSMLEDLYFDGDWYSQPDRKGGIENRQLPELFRSFMAVKNLYLSEKLASRIAPVLQEIVEGRTTDVLPALQNIFVKGLESSGSIQGSLGKFVAARQVANRPIRISAWTDS